MVPQDPEKDQTFPDHTNIVVPLGSPAAHQGLETI